MDIYSTFDSEAWNRKLRERDSIVDAFLDRRNVYGKPHRFAYLRRFAKTKPFVRTVLPNSQAA